MTVLDELERTPAADGEPGTARYTPACQHFPATTQTSGLGSALKPTLFGVSTQGALFCAAPKRSLLQIAGKQALLLCTGNGAVLAVAAEASRFAVASDATGLDVSRNPTLLDSAGKASRLSAAAKVACAAFAQIWSARREYELVSLATEQDLKLGCRTFRMFGGRRARTARRDHLWRSLRSRCTGHEEERQDRAPSTHTLSCGRRRLNRIQAMTFGVRTNHTILVAVILMCVVTQLG